MDALIYMIGTIVFFVIGFFTGWYKGVEAGKSDGYRDGIQDSLKEMDNIMRGGLSSTLDWGSSQQMLREKLWEN